MKIADEGTNRIGVSHYSKMRCLLTGKELRRRSRQAVKGKEIEVSMQADVESKETITCVNKDDLQERTVRTLITTYNVTVKGSGWSLVLLI